MIYYKVMEQRKPTPKAKPAVPVADDGRSELPTEGIRWGYAALLAAGLALLGGSAALAFVNIHAMAGWEARIFEAINGAWLPRFVADQIASPVSDAVWGILALIVFFLLIPRFRYRAWQYAVAAGSTYVFVAIIERVVDRARPVLLAPHDVVVRASQDGPGFPSGHVSVLSALCITVWIFVSWPWRILLVGLVAAEAWSRLYLGVHSPLDIIGGIGAAGVVVACIHLAPRRLRAIFKLM